MAHKKSSTLIPLASAEKLLKESGAERVSEDAKKEFVRALEIEGLKIARLAVELSKHSGRKTIKNRDVILAAKTL